MKVLTNLYEQYTRNYEKIYDELTVEYEDLQSYIIKFENIWRIDSIIDPSIMNFGVCYVLYGTFAPII